MTYCSDLSRRLSDGAPSLRGWARLFTVVVTLLVVAVFVAVVASRAGAAVSDTEELTRFGGEGSAAGQLGVPGGIATDPVNGHVYFLDSGNSRIDEFTPWGRFVKAFGWDVAPGAVNEQQEVRVRAGAGTFRLTFGASTTPDLAFNAPGDVQEEVPGGPVSVEAALNALPSVASGGGSVSVEAVPGTVNGVTPYVYVVAFKGSMAGTNVAQLTAANGSTALSGGSPSTGLEVRTRADGGAAGTGIESCTTESGCQKGLKGSGVGELDTAGGIVVDAPGNVYVREITNHRVQKFDSAGRFLLMFGTAGTGPGQFSGGLGMALGSSGKLFVGDVERIERFNLEGEYQASIPVPGENVQRLAVDPKSGDLYASTGKEKLFKLDSTTGAEIGRLEGEGDLATDATGDLFVPKAGAQVVLEYDAGGKPLSPASCCEAEPSMQGPTFPFGIDALATNAAGDLYVAYSASSVDSFIRSFGPGPVVFEGAPKVPPTIESEYAVSSDLDSAVVKAQINPHFWSDTTYYIQYGTGDCEVSACVPQPAAPGSKLTSHVLAAPVTSGDVLLSGLQPGTTYHYRFVSESGGGGPVFGPDRTFNTFPELSGNTDCSNQALRTGFSALLADCRAYEMVSPIDKDNGDVIAIPDFTGYRNGLAQSATNGGKFAYSSYRSFGDVKGAPYTSQYIAGRDPVRGWSTEAISPQQRLAAGASPDQQLDTDYKLFSGDLSSAWLSPVAEPTLAPGAVEGFRNLYRRDDVSGGFEALTTVNPPSQSQREFEPELQGVSVDGSHIVFRANDKLTPDAASLEGLRDEYQVYESYGGGNLRLVSVLPDGIASDQYASVGSLDGTIGSLSRLSSVSHAISSNGSRVYWSEMSDHAASVGKIYLRENADREQSALSGGECVEPDKACTVAVSSKASQFWVASPDGSRALYTIAEGAHAGELDEFNLEEDASTPIAEQVKGLLGASEDLSYIYFVSAEALAPGSKAGQPNLYVRHAETTSFIATLSSADTSGDITVFPVLHAARVTPDGRHIAFVSTVSLTGYDNVDVVTGEPDSEVYTYDAGSGQLDCVSCDRNGARPAGREVEADGNSGVLATAASIPGWENEFYASRALSDDGDRLFFDSYEGLVLRDTNGKEDVYEWEAVGSGDCTAQSPAFSPANGGCVSLISSGESPQDSEFMDASPSGSDVFFATNASLLPQDPGLVDAYDARVDGGFPAPAVPPASCEGEACQGAPAPPNDSTPASASFSGPGDLVSTLATTTKKAVQPKKTAAQVRSANLARALKACRTKTQVKRRKSCEAAARKRYGASAKSKTAKSTRGRGK